MYGKDIMGIFRLRPDQLRLIKYFEFRCRRYQVISHYKVIGFEYRNVHNDHSLCKDQRHR